MIVKLKGHIDNIDEENIDLDVQGVVYRILMSKKNIIQLGPIGSYIEIFIYEIMREDARILSGFLDKDERETFSDLLTVQGVGSKMAINIMSNLENKKIIFSINNGDTQIFRNVSGVGNKLALRIVNELKEKIKKKITIKNVEIVKENDLIFRDLVSCLLNLGFSQKICESTASYVINNNQEKELEQLIPIAVKSLSNPAR
ncbi:MAG: Holliday junction branch migration protein RuvA [Pelagibacteraceae bacterium TMED65]|nr:Holliday junction branch migration protein RuvA [Rickettsiales bacterium]OUU52126.1 MAG: Holliday junction branch migration protein RuvA [Pelagibacteraceae bacterium TMED65]|tara:strand:- start:2786 stop:3388 length:603 start_codon:yes stop_codon:yes gene_type:complete